ncbi:hypothetical protein ACFE04_007496 [Oxalis oulophora]
MNSSFCLGLFLRLDKLRGQNVLSTFDFIMSFESITHFHAQADYLPPVTLQGEGAKEIIFTVSFAFKIKALKPYSKALFRSEQLSSSGLVCKTLNQRKIGCCDVTPVCKSQASSLNCLMDGHSHPPIYLTLIIATNPSLIMLMTLELNQEQRSSRIGVKLEGFLMMDNVKTSPSFLQWEDQEWTFKVPPIKRVYLAYYKTIRGSGDSEISDNINSLAAVVDNDDAESCSCEFVDEENTWMGSSQSRWWWSGEIVAASMWEEGEEECSSGGDVISREIMDAMEDKVFWETCIALGYP